MELETSILGTLILMIHNHQYDVRFTRIKCFRGYSYVFPLSLFYFCERSLQKVKLSINLLSYTNEIKRKMHFIIKIYTQYIVKYKWHPPIFSHKIGISWQE